MAPTLGFASSLSHTIIRETQEDDTGSVHSTDSNSTTISITDEELALLGAPWAKEGMLSRKQYWESTSKRAKDKRWMDVFVVIQKGEMKMFIFGDHSSGGSGAAVGGGNWLVSCYDAFLASESKLINFFLYCSRMLRRSGHCSLLTHWRMFCRLQDIDSAHTAWC